MIIKYNEAYRDDMIFMVLQAKDALRRKPSINPDLLDVKANYFDKGDMFFLAIGENDRVIGCGGKEALSHFSYTFENGIYGILGANGAARAPKIYFEIFVLCLAPDVLYIREKNSHGRYGSK